MEPNITLKRGFKREQIVLQVVLSGKHFKTVARTIVERLSLNRFCAQLLVTRLLIGENACLCQFLTQLRQVTLTFRLSQRNQNTFQVVQIGLALLNLLCQHGLRCFRLII